MEKKYFLNVLYFSENLKDRDFLLVKGDADIILSNLKFLTIEYNVTGWRYNKASYWENLYRVKVDHELIEEEKKEIIKSLGQKGFKLELFPKEALGDLEDIVS